MYPADVEPVDVTFSDTAPTPFAGTNEPSAVIWTSSSYPPETCLFTTTRDEFGL